MDLSGAAWRKSTYSGGNGGQCVEVAAITSHPDSPETICAVRDSKKPRRPGPGVQPRAMAHLRRAGQGREVQAGLSEPTQPQTAEWGVLLGTHLRPSRFIVVIPQPNTIKPMGLVARDRRR